METITEIKNIANLIRDATKVGENTAERVGGVLVDMAEYMSKSVDIQDIDLDDSTIKNIAKAEYPCRLSVVNTVAGKKNCGVLECFSDSNGHMVTQVFITHYRMPGATEHDDDIIHYYTRSYHISGGTSTIPAGEWGEWEEYGKITDQQIDSITNNI